MGAPEGPFAYDCERPVHRREVAPFRIARDPVTCGEHLAFMEDGGYRRRELWTAAGWEWREQEQVDAPLYWEPDGDGGWLDRSFDRREPVDPERVLCNVSAHEADAHAAWAGARLPTEAEWELAAQGAPDGPGAANLDQLAFAPAARGAYPAAPSGCRGMLGDAWEWTSTPFEGYPGFRAFPYPEYAEVFFGPRYRVLRGGSWATQPIAARVTFRNWDLPAAAPDLLGAAVARGTPRERTRGAGSSCSRGPSGWTSTPAAPGGASPTTPSPGSPPRRRRCRPSTSTTSAAPRSSSASRACPSTTRAAPSCGSCAASPTASSPATVSASWWSWARGRRARPPPCSTRCATPGALERYVPFDVCPEAILAAAGRLVEDYPGLEVHGVAGDFSRHLPAVPERGAPPRLVAFLGGTIGNLEPAERAPFLASVAGLMDDDDLLLVGTDLAGDADRIRAAYDDAEGVTAQFNLNLLRVLNRELGADFDVAAFEHVALYDPGPPWIEMRLRARSPQLVRVAALGMEVALRRGRGDAHRDLLQVHPGDGRGDVRGGGPAAPGVARGPAGMVRRVARPPRVTGATAHGCASRWRLAMPAHSP